MAYAYKEFPYVTPPALSGESETRHRVVIVGAGPIGLAMAIDLALKGVPSVVLDDNNMVSTGSRAICWAKRTLEVFDRLGVGKRMVEKGVTWKVGRLYRGEEEVCNFDLLPEDGHRMPAFINLQQYYVEEYLVARCREFPELIALRFKNKVVSVSQSGDQVSAKVDTPDGAYEIEAQYLLACDGAGSPVRQMMGLDFAGQLFEERFLIADIVMEADFPCERRFWFEPPFHAGQSALLHKQPDNIYRIDLQLGWDADPEEEKKPENVVPRIKRMIGDRPFEIDWVSVYTFQCRRLERFLHDRVIFAGDSAHVVSPFGARGGNGGIQDVDNLGWKLALVLSGEGSPDLLESYNTERTFGADENIMNSSRSTNFMSPKEGPETLFRAAVLDLAGEAPFARVMVNSGRLSVPCALDLRGADSNELPVATRPGTSMLDAPLDDEWLLEKVGGEFMILGLNTEAGEIEGARTLNLKAGGLLVERYLGAARQAVYLIRPDQHIAARWLDFDPASLSAAIAKAKGH